MTRRPLLSVTVAAVLIAAAAMPAAAGAASSKSTFTIRGAGFGHGVGMSQYGAMGFAEHGATAAQILAHYYTGTALGQTDPAQVVRVLLDSGAGARFSGATQAGTRRLNPATTYSVRPAGGQLVLRSPRGSRLGSFTAPLQVAGSPTGVTVGGRRYRGTLELRPSTFGGVNTINAVGLDDYLRGVVPAESPASWPQEALRAQAIAARTYAITTSRGGTDFSQYADTRSQMYLGLGVETAATNTAVDATRGQVVTYQGKPVTTFFFSTSGGRTEDIENTSLGQQPLPWLKSVEDPYDSVSPRHVWKPQRLGLKSVGRKLGSLVKGSFRGIRVTQRGVSPRIVTAQVIGTRGTTVTTGATLRARLGLLDTWAYFTSITSRPSTPTDTPPVGSDGSGGATAPAAGAARVRSVATLRGSVTPLARGEAIAVQVRLGRRWVAAGQAHALTGGRYAIGVPKAGLYRVVAAGAAGPAVRVR